VEEAQRLRRSVARDDRVVVRAADLEA